VIAVVAIAGLLTAFVTFGILMPQAAATGTGYSSSIALLRSSTVTPGNLVWPM
jgi:hypothetical protein